MTNQGHNKNENGVQLHPPLLVPEGLKEHIWHLGTEPPILHQLVEPEANLLVAETTALAQLTPHLSTVSATAMIRTWLKTLADSTRNFPLEELA